MALIENGTYRARATIGAEHLAGVKKLLLPPCAISKSPAGSPVLILYTRTLGFAGHPPLPIPRATVEACMGIAWRYSPLHSERLDVATYGEWDSHIEGRASVAVALVEVPEGLETAHSPSHMGEHSVAAGRGEDVPPPEGTYWYASAGPALGWKKL
eukprot:m51a1_g11030 hypothetical protein (156) ;mRNA; r:423688-424155